MPARHPCSYYHNSCTVGLITINNPSGRESISPLAEDGVERTFCNGRRIEKFVMVSWGEWEFGINGATMHVDIHRYCPECGHSVLMKMDRVMNIFRRFTAFAADEFEYQDPDGSMRKSFP